VDNITEQVLKQNYVNQFNVNKSVSNMTLWDIRDGLKKNFTFAIIALNSFRLNSSSSIVTSRVGLYSRFTQIRGKIDVSGYGCLAGDGIGRGRALGSICSGSGGSHGGLGGRGKTIKQSLSPEYDDCAQF
jgi:hypothetical protein